MANNQIQALKQVLNADSVREQFQKSLGTPEKAENFMADIITMSTNTNLLAKCDVGDVVKLCGKSALLDLSFSKGEAFILPFKEKGVAKATFVISAKGWRQLAYRTDKYTFMNAEVVYEGDIESYNRFTKEIVWGKKKSDKVVGFFAMFKVLTESGRERTHIDYWTVEYMAKYAKHYSPSVKYDSNVTVKSLIEAANKEDQFGLGWTNNFHAMAKKTILSHLLSHEGDFSDSKMRYASNLETETAIPNRNEEVAANASVQTIEEAEAEVIETTAEPTAEQEKASDVIPPFMTQQQ